jgi:RNA polymerase sigma-70 factor (ECF subfamily)
MSGGRRVREKVEESDMVTAARTGDEGAFTWLYHRYSRMVHGILLARVPRDAVEDLVQDVFLSVYRRVHTLRDAAAFGGWLAQIARNRAADFHRREALNAPLREDHPLPSPDPETDEARRALQALRSLPEAYRETLALRLVEGMSGEEIAARTGLSPGSVRVNLHRGMKLLREKLGGRDV